MTIACIQKISTPLIALANRLQPAWWLFVRIWIAVVFFKSGLVKIDDFDTTVLLFENEYQVPILSPYFAAVMGTFFELVCPVFLVLGLGTRLAAIPLLKMALVIQLTYLDHVQHYYWMILLAALVVHGAGKWSADYVIAKKYGQKPTLA